MSTSVREKVYGVASCLTSRYWGGDRCGGCACDTTRKTRAKTVWRLAGDGGESTPRGMAVSTIRHAGTARACSAYRSSYDQMPHHGAGKCPGLSWAITASVTVPGVFRDKVHPPMSGCVSGGGDALIHDRSGPWRRGAVGCLRHFRFLRFLGVFLRRFVPHTPLPFTSRDYAGASIVALAAGDISGRRLAASADRLEQSTTERRAQAEMLRRRIAVR